jgi:hypothetical protein
VPAAFSGLGKAARHLPLNLHRGIADERDKVDGRPLAGLFKVRSDALFRPRFSSKAF